MADSTAIDRFALRAQRVLDESTIFAALERGGVFVSLNAEKLYWIREGAISSRCIQKAEFTVDGRGGEIFARVALGLKAARKIDLPQLILASAWVRNRRIFLLGAQPVINADAVSRLRANGIAAAGLDGFQGFDESVAAVRAWEPALVFVGTGSPAQENLAARLHDAIPGVAVVCCGGAINTMAGHINRCPQWLDRLYLEWAYRLVQQPARIRRLHRLLALPTEIVRYLMRPAPADA